MTAIANYIISCLTLSSKCFILEKWLDYIHWNPVKHGLVKDSIQWQWSSLSKWIRKGVYDKDWGCIEIPNALLKMEFE